jgi:hypothetical protein
MPVIPFTPLKESRTREGRGGGGGGERDGGGGSQSLDTLIRLAKDQLTSSSSFSSSLSSSDSSSDSYEEPIYMEMSGLVASCSPPLASFTDYMDMETVDRALQSLDSS